MPGPLVGRRAHSFCIPFLYFSSSPEQAERSSFGTGSPEPSSQIHILVQPMDEIAAGRMVSLTWPFVSSSDPSLSFGIESV